MTKDLNVSTSQSSFTHKKLIVISVASTGCSISEEFLESSLARPFWFTFALLVLHSLLTGAQIAHAIIVFWLHIDCCICSSGVVSYWSLWERKHRDFEPIRPWKWNKTPVVSRSKTQHRIGYVKSRTDWSEWFFGESFSYPSQLTDGSLSGSQLFSTVPSFSWFQNWHWWT